MMLTSRKRNGCLIQNLYNIEYVRNTYLQDVGVDTKKEFILENMFLFTHLSTQLVEFKNPLQS